MLEYRVDGIFQEFKTASITDHSRATPIDNASCNIEQLFCYFASVCNAEQETLLCSPSGLVTPIR